MKAMAQKAADDEIARLKAEDAKRRIEFANRAAAAAAAQAPPPAAPKKEEEPKIPPEPAGAGGAPPGEAPPAAPPPITNSPAQRMAILAAGAVAMIQDEVQIRPRQYVWNYELWKNLPEELLDAVLASTDPIAMFDAFKVEGFDLAKLELVKQGIAANAKMVAWLKRGWDELQDWKRRLADDPTFDPADLEDEGDEPEEGA